MMYDMNGMEWGMGLIGLWCWRRSSSGLRRS
jgi:hypothetical protein